MKVLLCRSDGNWVLREKTIFDGDKPILKKVYYLINSINSILKKQILDIYFINKLKAPEIKYHIGKVNHESIIFIRFNYDINTINEVKKYPGVKWDGSERA